MSLEMWSPPSGRIPVYQMAPSRKRATSVVPPPRSMSRIPSSFSSAEITASAEASGSRTRSWTCNPARLTLRTRFLTEVVAPVTRWTSTSSRTPDIPSGSLTPSSSSTRKVCGRTWMISRSWGRLMARAASRARSISAGLTSRCLPDTATTPRLLTPRMCPPATPAMTEATSTPAISSASPTACLMDSTVESILTTTPLRRPRDGLTPTPMMSRLPTGDHSAITQQIFVVPTSSPAITWRPLVLAMSPLPRRGFEHDLVAEAQVDGRHRFPDRAELGQHAQQTAQPGLPVFRPQPHLDAVHGVEHGPIGPAHVDLGDLSEQGAARAQQDAEQGDSGCESGRSAGAGR